MLVRPWPFDFDLVDSLLEAALGDGRNGEPFDALGGLDAVAVVPVPLHELGTVVDHVFVAAPDQVEKDIPGNGAGLDDANAHVSTFIQGLTGTAAEPSLRLPFLVSAVIQSLGREITYYHALEPQPEGRQNVSVSRWDGCDT